jgi:hypothetical protein
VLVLFEMMSGLKVNFHKSMLVGVNISDFWLREAAPTLRCKVGEIPFVHLGLPIGGDSRRLGFWNRVLARIRSRLSGWGSRLLVVDWSFSNMSCHLCLFMLFLSSKPPHVLSLPLTLF